MGVLSENDSDYLMAKKKGNCTLSELSFSQISLEKEETLLDLSNHTDRVIVTMIPIGWSNFMNIKILENLVPYKIIIFTPAANPNNNIISILNKKRLPM